MLNDVNAFFCRGICFLYSFKVHVKLFNITLFCTFFLNNILNFHWLYLCYPSWYKFVIHVSTFKVSESNTNNWFNILQILRRSFLCLKFQYLFLQYLFGIQSIRNFFLFYFPFACNIFMIMMVCWYFIMNIQSGQTNYLLIFSFTISRLVISLELV